MTMKRLGMLGFCALLGACANMSTLQTAETLPEGQGEFAVGAGYITHEAITDADDSKVTAPYLEFQYRRGLAENIDAGIKATLIGTGGADVKYQFYNSEKLDLAVGTGLAYMSIESGDSKSSIIDWTVPLYVSSDVSDSVTLYASPKYFLRKVSGADALHVLGATAGLKWGKESGVMVETSYAKALGEDFKSLQYNAALFMKGDWF
jgi:hypothetical protein